MTRRVPVGGVVHPIDPRRIQPEDKSDRALAAALHEPAARLIGCACGRQHVEDRDKPFVSTDGTVHRYGRPCYRVESEP